MEKHKGHDKVGMVIGGCFLIGLGIGFIFLERSALLFVACMIIGLGAGLFFSSHIGCSKK